MNLTKEKTARLKDIKQKDLAEAKKVMRKKSWVAAISIIVVPSVFLTLLDVIIGDTGLFLLINQRIAHPYLDVACAYTSPVLFGMFYILILAKLWLSRKPNCIATAITSIVTGALSYAVGSLTKLLFMRPRPFDTLQTVRVIGPWETGGFSFPSTTTMLAFGLAIPILMLYERRLYGIILSFFSFFIGFSVVYAGFHFPADVVAGIFLSFSITTGTSRIRNQAVRFLEKRRVRSLNIHLERVLNIVNGNINNRMRAYK
jgi:undecaprenyl-diphosphatase